MKKHNNAETESQIPRTNVVAIEDSAVGMNEIGEGNSEKETSSYKINRSWG